MSLRSTRDGSDILWEKIYIYDKIVLYSFHNGKICTVAATKDIVTDWRVYKNTTAQRKSRRTVDVHF